MDTGFRFAPRPTPIRASELNGMLEEIRQNRIVAVPPLYAKETHNGTLLHVDAEDTRALVQPSSTTANPQGFLPGHTQKFTPPNTLADDAECWIWEV